MKIRSGHIPSDLVMFVFEAGTRKLKLQWTEAEYGLNEMKVIKATQTHVFDADDDLHIKKFCAGLSNSNEFDEIRLENKPISGLRVVGYRELDMVHHVLSKEGYCFDIAEDVLLHSVMSKGVLPGGVLPGSYVWGMIGSQLKLVEVDSELYNALIEAGDRKMLSSIPKKKLQIGGIYQNTKGDISVFLGYTTTSYWALQYPRVGYGQKPDPNAMIGVASKTYTRLTLWFDVTNWDLKQTANLAFQAFFDETMAKRQFTHNFSLKKSHGMVKKLADIKIPEDVIEQVRLMAVDQYLAKVNMSGSWTYRNENAAGRAAPYVLMREDGKPMPVVDDPTFKKLQGFIA